MPTNSKVKQELLSRLGGISRQALSQRAARIKKKYGPMTTEEAIYVIAHTEGIDLSKFLQLPTIDRVRSLVPKENQPNKLLTHPQQRVKTQQNESYPLVTKTQVRQANNLGNDVYPKLFILENSIRSLIVKCLEPLDKNWWNIDVPLKVRDNVSRTMNNEKRYPYRKARGNHPISYANFADLNTIIQANQSIFQKIIIRFDWFSFRMDEVYMARNNLAHCVSLSNDDIARINLFYREWATLLETAGY
jgi:hypothetical protein